MADYTLLVSRQAAAKERIIELAPEGFAFTASPIRDRDVQETLFIEDIVRLIEDMQPKITAGSKNSKK